MTHKDLPKLVAVVGATASGKSALALQIARKHTGELICADSRQIYKGLNIGSAKDPGVWQETPQGPTYLVDGVPEHVVDVVDPNEEFNVGVYQDLAFTAIDQITDRGHVPILVGGTGLYVQAVLENLQFPNVAPNQEIRKRLATKSLADLQATYEACDPVGALSIDHNNRRRLVRAIEVCFVTQRPFSELQGKGEPRVQALQLAFDIPRAQLYARIEHRVLDMVQAGLVEEVAGLLDAGVDARKSALSGIGYQEVVRFLQGDINHEEMIEQIQRNTRRLAKKQVAWFKRDSSVVWIQSVEEGLERAAAFLA